MNINSIKTFFEKTWDKSTIPALKEYIRIPAVSPFFAKDWETSGFLHMPYVKKLTSTLSHILSDS